MSYFSWEQRLNTGIDIIDLQHQRIARYINDLYSAARMHDKGLVGITIIKLLDYIQSHLRFEEEVLDAAGYSALEAHKMAHGSFERRINRYYRRHNQGMDITMPLLSELKLWLMTHILHEDRDYVPTLQRHMEGSAFAGSMAF